MPHHLDVSVVGAVAALVLALTAAITDLKSRTIGNGLTYSFIMLGLGLGLLGNVFSSILMGCVFMAVPAWLLFQANSMGGGDLKLLVALGALLGFPDALDLLFWSLLGGGLLGVVMLAWTGRAHEFFRDIVFFIQTLPAKGIKKVVPMRDVYLPFAVPIFVATVLVIVGTPGPSVWFGVT